MQKQEKKTCAPELNSEFMLRSVGQPLTKDYRAYLTVRDKIISFWHDLELYPSEGAMKGLTEAEKKVAHEGELHMVVEVPRWWSAKMEIAKDEYLTPLKQSLQEGRLKYIPNVFPHKGYPWTYGMLPQTYQDPNVDDPVTQLPGGGNPLAVCELGGAKACPGQVKRVKILGSLAVINEGKTDWKVIAVDLSNPEAAALNNIHDVEPLMPGYLDTIKEWFRVYKLAEGLKENQIAMDGQFKDRRSTLLLIDSCHKSWRNVKVQPGMQTRISMADLSPEMHDAADVLPRTAEDRDVREDIDLIAAEKSHFLSANWPPVASCPGGGILNLG